MFARHGIPVTVIYDNGPQFSSHKYRSFTKDWQFSHITSSPCYPRANGLAEISVKSVKKLLKKCNRDHQEFQKGLLILRNTPTKNGLSPAQLLYGRQLRDILPTTASKLTPSGQLQRNIYQERKQAKAIHDRRCLKPAAWKTFVVNQRVIVQNNKTKEWDRRGVIIKEVFPRSFLVQMDNGGTLIRRNQSALRKLHDIVSNSVKGTVPNSAIPNISNKQNIGNDKMVDLNSTIPYDESEDENDDEEETVQNRSQKGRILKKRWSWIMTTYDT